MSGKVTRHSAVIFKDVSDKNCESSLFYLLLPNKGNLCTSADATHTHFGMHYLLFLKKKKQGLVFKTHLLKEELSEKVKKEQ